MGLIFSNLIGNYDRLTIAWLNLTGHLCVSIDFRKIVLDFFFVVMFTIDLYRK